MGAPIVVHGLSLARGRAVTINDEIVGLVYDDQGLIELLRRAGVYDAEQCLDDPQWIEWRGGRAHRYEPV
ncbi:MULTISPECIES: hypothetical protein [unclassified Streptomyces]|uniref:hypothetical protein n=1 Tax=unclassified Streptomyces TaxID=2593676 RepID=UPI0029A46CD2|nr:MULTISPECIES: hypothetical protein [unclassified Streptomyces]MDX3772227.1 hypothetical protein [Streptomyces sp. AK08-01B]MDX3821774.1 hypothetical protein [Streptomyces sp. AK08-01A]